MQIREDFRGGHFLTLADYSKEDLDYFMDLAGFLKAQKKAGRPIDYLRGKTLGMIFEKSSTRTRVSFEAGMYYLGGAALFLSARDIQLGRGEPYKDTARVMSRYLDGLMIRTFAHSTVEQMAEYASVPVINGLTDLLHPCQVLADLLTIKEKKQVLAGIKLVFMGDGGSNMAHSLLLGSAIMGINCVIVTHRDYMPDQAIYQRALSLADSSTLTVSDDVFKYAAGADVLYTDVWTSMGQEEESERRIEDLSPYRLSMEVLGAAARDAVILHCLPAKRGQEISDRALESERSAVFDQAENRMWAQMAVMTALMSG